MKALCNLAYAILVCVTPAFAGVITGSVSVTSPANGAQVASPFQLTAKDTDCGSSPVIAMGYSLDHSGNARVTYETSIDAVVHSALGPHILHVKSWGKGTACVTDVHINVVADPGAQVPADALVFRGIAQDTNWKASHDTATGTGTTYGDMYMVQTPSLSGNARQFTTTYYESTGERYSSTFGSDTFTHNFLYDGWIYIKSPNGGLANLELDINQVIANGDTVILSFQCDGYSGTWDYGENAGTVQKTKAHWINSSRKCNPRSWKPNTWHHVQIRDTRNDDGTVTYHTVWLDGVRQDIEATVPGEFSLGWASVVQTNFQIDGLGASGSVIAYLDNLTVFAW